MSREKTASYSAERSIMESKQLGLVFFELLSPYFLEKCINYYWCSCFKCNQRKQKNIYILNHGKYTHEIEKLYPFNANKYAPLMCFVVLSSSKTMREKNYYHNILILGMLIFKFILMLIHGGYKDPLYFWRRGLESIIFPFQVIW